MYKLYRIIAVISILIRQFLLPNPFEALGENFVISINNMDIPLTPDIANWVTEPILHTITFAVVGIYYKKGHSDPALGSVLYLVFYAVHVGLIYIICCFDFSLIAVIIIFILYSVLHIAIITLKNKLVN